MILHYGTKEGHMESYGPERPIVTVRARERIHYRNLCILFNNKTTTRRGTGRSQHTSKIIHICNRSILNTFHLRRVRWIKEAQLLCAWMQSKVKYLNIIRTDQLIGLAVWQTAEEIESLLWGCCTIPKFPNISTLMFNEPLTLYSLVVTLCFPPPWRNRP